MLHNWVETFVQIRLFIFHIYQWRFHEIFFKFSMAIEANIERLDNFSYFITDFSLLWYT